MFGLSSLIFNKSERKNTNNSVFSVATAVTTLGFSSTKDNSPKNDGDSI